MAKDIIIQDEYYRANHMSGVTRLRTELEDGGVCYWIPEDEAVALTEKTITKNGTYRAVTDDVSGYSTVTVSIENSFSEYDEGRVISGGVLVDQTSRIITANGTYDTTTNNTVSVETSSNLITKSITSNGSYNASSDDVDGYSSVIVSVPNTYTQTDEGKVVNNSQLVSQTSRTITANGTYDTTTNNSISVETSSNLITKSITSNGSYNASSDDVDGYSSVTVSVPNTYTQSDEGKVVNNSQLVSQTSRTITANGTYDTTTNNSVTVLTPVDDIIKGTIQAYTANDAVSYIRKYAFAECRSLMSVDITGLENIEDYAFYNCVLLRQVGCTSIATIGNSAFKGCVSLSTMNCSTATSIGSGAFENCQTLSSVTLGSLPYIGELTFNSCSALMGVTITGSSMCSLMSTDVFYGTPMYTSSLTGSFGSIYVPGELVSAYKTAANWSFYSDRIVGGGGSEDAITTENGDVITLENGEELLFDN